MTQRTHHLIALATASRGQLIALLQANDPNGCYTDDDCKAKGFAPLSRADCLNIMSAQESARAWYANRLTA